MSEAASFPRPAVRINGASCAAIPVMDRGLMYGDGVFRTMRAEQGHIRHWPRHYRKLAGDCARLDIPAPSRETLEAELTAVLREQPDAVCKIVVTRGQGGRGYGPNGAEQPARIVLAFPLPVYPERYRQEGIRLHPCALRLAHQPQLAGIKHLNRLENVLARREWSDPDVPEGLLLDTAGSVIEGTMSNLFLRQGATLLTPDLSHCGVAGVQRERILEAAPRLGLKPEIRTLTPEELCAADEVLVCNSVIGLWPVQAWGSQRWRVEGLVPSLERVLETLDD